MTNCKYAKFKDGKFLFPQSPKKVIMTSSFDKNNLGEEKRGTRTFAESILRKQF